MSATELTLNILSRGKPIKALPEEFNIPRNAPSSELYDRLAALAKISVHRLRITKGSDGSFVASSKDTSISKTGLMNGSKIYVKDLGPQIAWRTVFVIEYIGPLIIHPIFYFLRPYIYSSPTPSSFPAPSTLQSLSLLLMCVHFLKREFETLFVHRFSLATMPARNIFKNSGHYWLLAGINIAYWIYRPDSPTAAEMNLIFTVPGLILFLFGELANFNAHLTLRRLRSSGGKERGIPRGFGFGMVTCPNYSFELVAWIGILLVTRSLSTAVFGAVSLGQMVLWSKKKERNYRRDFGDKYKKKRYGVIPGVY